MELTKRKIRGLEEEQRRGWAKLAILASKSRQFCGTDALVCVGYKSVGEKKSSGPRKKSTVEILDFPKIYDF